MASELDREAVKGEIYNLSRKQGLVSIGTLLRKLSIGVQLPNGEYHAVPYRNAYDVLVYDEYVKDDVGYEKFLKRNGLTDE